MDLDTVAKHKQAFLRLVGTDDDDPALVEQGEAVDDVVYQFLTIGCRNAQRYLLKSGYTGWFKRSGALTFAGDDSTDGGTYASLPSDFLRTFGHRRLSALVEANGDRWGREIDAEQRSLQGDFYYILDELLWLARLAAPPTTLYLEYHHFHDAWSTNVTIDFPLQVRTLIVAEAADAAKMDNWLPGGAEMIQKIDARLKQAQRLAQDFARQTKSPRQFRKPYRAGNHW